MATCCMSLPSVKFWHSEKATFAYCSVKNIFFVYFFFGECQILTLGKEYLCLVSILTLGNNYLCRVFFFFAECIWWLCRVPLWWGIWLAKISFLVVTWVYHHWVKIGYGGSSAGYNSLGNIQELLSKKIGKKITNDTVIFWFLPKHTTRLYLCHAILKFCGTFVRIQRIAKIGNFGTLSSKTKS
jgi:hypothetical protein